MNIEIRTMLERTVCDIRYIFRNRNMNKFGTITKRIVNNLSNAVREHDIH